MKSAILVSAAVSSLVSIIGTVVALNVLVPAVVEAQETRIRAESVVVVDENGTGRVRIGTGTGARSSVGVFSQAGIPRIAVSTGGGLIGDQPDEASVSVFPPEGAPTQGSPGAIARLGTDIDGVGSVMVLRDRQGQTRIWLRVDGDGNPSIEILDASGNVTWRAQ